MAQGRRRRPIGPAIQLKKSAAGASPSGGARGAGGGGRGTRGGASAFLGDLALAVGPRATAEPCFRCARRRKLWRRQRRHRRTGASARRATSLLLLLPHSLLAQPDLTAAEQEEAAAMVLPARLPFKLKQAEGRTTKSVRVRSLPRTLCRLTLARAEAEKYTACRGVPPAARRRAQLCAPSAAPLALSSSLGARSREH